MKKIIKIIFLSLLIQSIYCQRKCLINDDDECEAENDETYICKGNYQDGCEAIPRCKYHSSNENNCALYPVSKDKAGKCISVGGDKCEEQLYCDYMTNLLDDSACRDQPVNPEFDGIKFVYSKAETRGVVNQNSYVRMYQLLKTTLVLVFQPQTKKQKFA